MTNINFKPLNSKIIPPRLPGELLKFRTVTDNKTFQVVLRLQYTIDEVLIDDENGIVDSQNKERY